MSKDKKELLTIFLFVMLFSFIWLAGDLYQMSKVCLPDNINNLQTFTEKMPVPKEIHTFEKDGLKYIEVIGHLPCFPATPSGNPIYIFDDKGQIIYWTGDAGDSPYWEEWGQYRLSTKNISLQDALESVSKNN